MIKVKPYYHSLTLFYGYVIIQLDRLTNDVLSTTAPAVIKILTTSKHPPWAAKNKADVPVCEKKKFYNKLKFQQSKQIFNEFEIEYYLFTFRFAFGSAPCSNNSITHSLWPPAAEIIRGVVPSFSLEKKTGAIKNRCNNLKNNYFN